MTYKHAFGNIGTVATNVEVSYPADEVVELQDRLPA